MEILSNIISVIFFGLGLWVSLHIVWNLAFGIADKIDKLEKTQELILKELKISNNYKNKI